MVLIGDALHSAHFSIGSGTRLAIDDAIALVKALEAEADTSAALNRYQTERKPIVQKLVKAARSSADWYENFAEHMKLDLMDFAYSYITRTGRIDDAQAARDVAGLHGTLRGITGMTREIADQVPPDSAGAREIGFTIPQTYNASRILFDNLANGRGGPSRADRSDGDAQLCRTLRAKPAAGDTVLSRSALRAATAS